MAAVWSGHESRVYGSFIDTIEWIAAGFVGIVALNIFLAVILRTP